MTLIEKMKCQGAFLNGQFRFPKEENGTLLSKNPGNILLKPGEFPFHYEFVNEAVEAGSGAFKPWKNRTYAERKNFLKRYRDNFEKSIDPLSETMSFETGKPVWDSQWEMRECLALMDFFLEHLDAHSYEKLRMLSPQEKVEDRPLGVVALISSPILPLLSAHRQFFPALLLGNVIILKSSRYTPALGQRLADIVQATEFPPGVLNIIYGDEEMARRLSTHSEVRAVYYSGTFETSLQIRKQLAADFNKFLVLETGGKNGAVVWDDVDVNRCAQELVYSSFVTTGQRNNSTHRILVHENIHQSFIKVFHETAKRIKVGYAFSTEEPSFMGPLLSEHALENYLRFQGIAVREGCEEIMRGKGLERAEKGYYVSPSIHLVPKADKKSMYQKTEVFGPNIAFYRITECEEAASILNLPEYGMVASIYSANKDIYRKIKEDLNYGLVLWNAPTTQTYYHLPQVGIGKSGNFRPMGMFSSFQSLLPICSVEKETPEFAFPLSP